MPFADIEIKFNQGQNKIRRTEFMNLSTGAHLIRILEPQARTKPTHYFTHNRATVLCLGENCPICANNKKLIMQFPENFRDQTGYNKVNYRFFVNVLDKTQAKVCECGKEYKTLATTICTCGKVLPAAAPLNKVKVLSKGLTLRDDLNSIDTAILDGTGEPIGLTNYDIVLMVSGTGRETKITPVPRTESREPVTLEGANQLFDLEKAVIVLSAEEMLDAQRGISLKDIFTARKAKETPVKSLEPVASAEDLNKINDELAALFNQS